MPSAAHPAMWVSLEKREGPLINLRSGKQCLTTNALITSKILNGWKIKSLWVYLSTTKLLG